MMTSPLTNRGLTLSAKVTLVLLTALAALVAGAAPASGQGTVPDAPESTGCLTPICSAAPTTA